MAFLIAIATKATVVFVDGFVKCYLFDLPRAILESATGDILVIAFRLRTSADVHFHLSGGVEEQEGE